MSSRLAFQTQLASIMEALANAAVAEICKLVDDDYAVVRLQMTQCQTENKVLKRKLHLLELKMARGNAERRLRESVMNRPRVQITTGDRLRQSSPSSDGVFHPRLDAGLWSERAAAENTPTKLTHSDDVQSRSPDVELVEPEAVTVKEEKVEPNGSEEEKTEPDVQLIGVDGVVDCIPFGATGSVLGHQDTQSTSCQPQSLSRTQNRRVKHSGSSSSSSSSSSSRGVEVSDSSPHLKCEVSGPQQETTNPQQFAEDGGACSNFGVLFVGDRPDNTLAQQLDEQARAVPEARGSSCSYSMVAAEFPPSSVNGWTSCALGLPLPLPQQRADGHKLHHPPSTKERLFVCSYCGKAFNRPKKVEIHQRVHTGEKPFSCSTCGKMFSEAGNLRKHHRVHTGEKPYSCGACGKGFGWIRNLKAHQRKSHPDIYTEGDQTCT